MNFRSIQSWERQWSLSLIGQIVSWILLGATFMYSLITVHTPLGWVVAGAVMVSLFAVSLACLVLMGKASDYL